MRIADSQLKGLSVVTETGDPIGKVAGMVIDVDSHSVIQYKVSRSRLLSALLPEEMLVHHNQVVSVDEEKMVVKGSLPEVEEAAKALKVREAASGSAIAQMTQEKAKG
jgi:sporulation protein YlmC with PRC-barrel domain